MLVLFGCSKLNVGPEPEIPESEKVSVAFALPGIGTEAFSSGWGVSSRASETDGDVKVVPLDEDATVRVVVYQRKGTNADLTNDKYVMDATYVAVKEDDNIVLKPCTIANDGTVTVNESNLMRLRFGTYDFYAITPALTLDSDHRKVDVHHGDDFAASLTEAVEVVLQPGGVAQKVTLDYLERKCSQLHFSISRAHKHITKAVFNSVKLSKITKDPATVLLTDAITTGDNTGEYEFPADTFAELNEDSEFLSAGADEVLPKSKGTFDLEMNVSFNDDDPTTLKATVPEMAFDPCVKYCFNLHLNGELVELRLIVSSWTDVPGWDIEIGSPGSGIIIVVGSWEIAGWNTTFGGQLAPVISTDSWTERNWNTNNVGQRPS